MMLILSSGPCVPLPPRRPSLSSAPPVRRSAISRLCGTKRPVPPYTHDVPRVRYREMSTGCDSTSRPRTHCAPGPPKGVLSIQIIRGATGFSSLLPRTSEYCHITLWSLAYLRLQDKMGLSFCTAGGCTEL
jgi:hypothetical protein